MGRAGESVGRKMETTVLEHQLKKEKKNLCISGPRQFKLKLLKGQPHTYHTEVNVNVN